MRRWEVEGLERKAGGSTQEGGGRAEGRSERLLMEGEHHRLSLH